ncbi:MAG: hypothetical protein NVS1B3_01420 [Candidatus Dormibacteraceae bacterium]
MRFLVGLAIGGSLALQPASVTAGSTWGSPEYGDPPGWCTNLSDMWTTSVVTNDPLVGTNPERDTFYGFHANPGYDEWYGFFYGDFRGTPGDASGWVPLLHENYPQHYHWNFADNGWAVHGHVKQYIAYYNWTFGGQCGLGAYGNASPPPYMADQYGYPVVDIYVDAVPPFDPKPYVAAITPTSVAFTWDPVADRGDGAGKDYFVSGLDHYLSWLTLGDRPDRLQLASTALPRILTLAGMSPRDSACVHVQAVDRVQNSTGDQVACAAPLAPPQMPTWEELASAVTANPKATGLVGLDTWYWLAPPPRAITAGTTERGILYEVTATPTGVDWDFGDGVLLRVADAAGFGQPYPQPSSVKHTYEAHSQSGYAVEASVRYAVTWRAVAGSSHFGPYPLGGVQLPAHPLTYRVVQAQPELLET